MQATVIDFHATWCAPCKAMGPTFDRMKAKYSDRATFQKVDIDSDPEKASEYEVSSVPTFVIVRKDGTKAELVGTAPPDQFEKFISENI